MELRSGAQLMVKFTIFRYNMFSHRQQTC